MITSTIQFLNSNDLQLPINFVAHTIVFLATAVVALYNKKMPIWHVTPLWWVGLLSAFNSITIALQWLIGPEFPLSYWNVSLFSETLSNIALAAIAAIMLCGTIRGKIKH